MAEKILRGLVSSSQDASNKPQDDLQAPMSDPMAKVIWDDVLTRLVGKYGKINLALTLRPVIPVDITDGLLSLWVENDAALAKFEVYQKEVSQILQAKDIGISVIIGQSNLKPDFIYDQRS